MSVDYVAEPVSPHMVREAPEVSYTYLAGLLRSALHRAARDLDDWAEREIPPSRSEIVTRAALIRLSIARAETQTLEREMEE